MNECQQQYFQNFQVPSDAVDKEKESDSEEISSTQKYVPVFGKSTKASQKYPESGSAKDNITKVPIAKKLKAGAQDLDTITDNEKEKVF